MSIQKVWGMHENALNQTKVAYGKERKQNKDLSLHQILVAII